MTDPAESRLRVLVADGRGEHFQQVVRTVERLGHVVIGGDDLEAVIRITRTEHPDVAVVLVGWEAEEALHVVDAIVRETSCPVIAVLDRQDQKLVEEAAARGISAYLTIGDDPEELQSSIDIVLRRFAEYRGLQGAFERRAVTERAKGILMEREGIDEVAAFERLRDEARRTNRKIVDVAEAVLGSHRLLARRTRPGDSTEPD